MSTSKAKPAKSPAPKKAAPKKAAPKKAAPKKAEATPKRHAARADRGAPIEAFFAKQPPALRPIVDALRALVEEVAPGAQSSLKWGMPVFTQDGEMMCAIGGHKAHVNLILAGPQGAFSDPKGLLTGEGKTGRHLKITSIDELPRAEAKAWIRVARDLSAAKAKG